MTLRLYYDDPYLAVFDATIAAVDRRDDRWLVALDRTAFYPTSGGQPFDTGLLGGARVVDVVEQEDGTIAHVVQQEPGTKDQTPRVGDRVHGEIEWTRRFDHMQQHTGQHVLSAAFERLFHVRTVSFHLGAEVSTIDLARDVSAAELLAAENEANRVVWDDRLVAIRYATAAEAAALPLRKEPTREGTLRLIDIAGFDLSACGGTHVARTGAIGIVAVSGWERFKGGQRLEFVCGGRALGRFRALRDTVATATRMLSAAAADLPATIERLQADAKEQKRAIVALHAELARVRADEMAQTAEMVELRAGGRVRLVTRAVDADASTLKSLASALTARPGFVVVLVSTSTPALLVVARSVDVRSIGAHEALATLTARFGGRGGGKAELAQAGGLNGSADEILALSRTLL